MYVCVCTSFPGDYYLRLLLEEDEESEETSAIKKSYVFSSSFAFNLQGVGLPASVKPWGP